MIGGAINYQAAILALRLETSCTNNQQLGADSAGEELVIRDNIGGAEELPSLSPTATQTVEKETRIKVSL